MWSFIVTLVALTMDVWGALKAMDKKTIQNLFSSCSIATLYPLAIFWNMLGTTVDGMIMLANLHEALGNDVISPLHPWSKSHIKIIFVCRIIMNLSSNVHEEIHNLNAF